MREYQHEPYIIDRGDCHKEKNYLLIVSLLTSLAHHPTSGGEGGRAPRPGREKSLSLFFTGGKRVLNPRCGNQYEKNKG
jgi:hypothetical protein